MIKLANKIRKKAKLGTNRRSAIDKYAKVQ